MLMSHGGRVVQLHHMANGFRVLVPGDLVRCAATGAAMPLDNLRHWSVARQEPHATAEAATKAEQNA